MADVNVTKVGNPQVWPDFGKRMVAAGRWRAFNVLSGHGPTSSKLTTHSSRGQFPNQFGSEILGSMKNVTVVIGAPKAHFAAPSHSFCLVTGEP